MTIESAVVDTDDRFDSGSSSRSVIGGISNYKLKCQKIWTEYWAIADRCMCTNAKQLSLHAGDGNKLDAGRLDAGELLVY